MTSAHQKFNNLEPQTPVFQIELVKSKLWSKLKNFPNEHNERAMNMTSRTKSLIIWRHRPLFSKFSQLVQKDLKICLKLINFLIEHNELTMKITYAYQKLHNLEPQTPVFQIELVYSKRFKNLLNIYKFWNEH